MNLWKWVRAEWDRFSAAILIAAGAVLLVSGWLGVSRSVDTTGALAYLTSGGLGGLYCLGLGASLLISADLHDEWRKLDRLQSSVDRLTNAPGPVTAAPAGEEVTLPPEPEPDGGNAPLEATARGRSMNFDGAAAVPGSGSVAGAATLARVVGTAGAAVSGLLVLTGWLRTSSALTTGPAFGDASISALGLLLLAVTAVGSTSWVKRRTNHRKSLLAEQWAVAFPDDPAPAATTVSGPVPDRVAFAPGLTEYHRPDCPALPLGDVTQVARGAVPPGLRPCALCEA